MHLPPVPRFFIRWSIRFILLAVLIGVPAGLIYLRQVGLGGPFKEQLAAALSGEKIKTQIGQLLFDPFQGLIARDVVVTDPTSSDRPLAQIARVVVSLKLSDLLAHKVSVDFIELDKTDVSIPLGDADAGQRLNLKDVTAQGLFLGDQLRLSYFEADLSGLKIVLNGLLRNPGSFHPPKQENGPATSPKQHQMITDVLAELNKLRFSGQSPELRAEINGDLKDLSTIKIAPISLRSGPIIGRRWRIEGIEANAQYLDGKFTLTQFSMESANGRFDLNAQYHDQQVDFEISGGIDMALITNFLPKDHRLRKLVFDEAPQLDASGTIALPFSLDSVDLTGALHAGRFVLDETVVDRFSMEFAFKNGQLFARDIRMAAAEGELTADVLYAPNDFRLRLTDTIAPTVFAPFMGPNERAFLKLMEFKDHPQVTLEVQGPKLDFAQITGTGTMKLGRTALRGSWMDSADSKIEIANKAVTYRNFVVKSGKGVGTGTFVYDFGAHQIRLDKINSTLSPVDVLMWADPRIAEALRPYKFHEPPTVQGGGLIHMEDPHKTNLSLVLDAQSGLDYELLKRTLSFGRTQGTVHIVGLQANVNLSSAKLMGGDVGVKAVISTDSANPVFGADIDLRRLDFVKLTKLYFGYDSSQGVVSGTFSFTAKAKEEAKLKGTGTIKVEDGRVLSIPVMGPLSEIINKIIPGAGFEAARQATANFQIGDGKVSTQNLAIEGLGFSLIGHGDISFVTEKMDMSVRINARGVPGIVLFPVSKLFEYVSTGTFSDPEWRPKITHFGDDPTPAPVATPGQQKAREAGH